jgi:hypothetical protein
MNKEQFKRERLYQVSIAVVRTMLKKNVITMDEYCMIDTALLEKYKPLLGGLQTKGASYETGSSICQNFH